MRRCVVAMVVLALVTACSGATDRSGDAPLRVGILRIVPDDNHADFVDELRRQGFRQGRDVELLPEDPDQLYASVEEAEAAVQGWLRGGLDLVIAFSTPFAELVSRLDAGVPGLFVVNDPLASGLVEDLRSPDGSMSGVTFRTPADRLLALAGQAFGELRTVGYLAPSDDPAVPGHREAFLAAADEFGIEVVERTFAGPDGVAAAAAELAAAGVQVVAIPNSNSSFQAAAQLREALDEERLPAVANTDLLDFAVIVLTPDGAELRRQLARQAALILDGTDVSRIPVEHPRKLTLIVNRSRARELGLPELPGSLLRQADVVR